MGRGIIPFLFFDKEDTDSVRRVLIRGVFWRILIIEGILLVWSLFYSFFTGEHDSPEALIGYAFRILVLIGIIVLFVVVTFRRFLEKRIIQPLEAIVDANRQIQKGDASAKTVRLPDGTPREIREISSTRTRMLEEIFKVSEERLRLVNFIRETFGRYVSKKVVDEVLSSPEGQKIGGRRQHVTILMSDLRGFTGLSENRDPEKMVGLLNRYLGRMSEVILEYDGLIDEFIGDAILAVFGIPEARENDALRAVACGVAMQNALAALNAQIVQEGYPLLEMGVGINTGPVIAGNIGSEMRVKYGIVGTAVNVAARIESNTTGGQVLIGESTYESVKGHVVVEGAQTVMMKGLKHPLVYFPVRGVGPPYSLELKPQDKEKEEVAISLPFCLWPMDNKRVVDERIHGETLTIGENTITARLEKAVDSFSDIKLKFDFCLDAHCFEDVYAKVVAVERPGKETVAHLRITAIQASDKALLTRWIKEGAA
jgi:class 3 adenylate cyclase/HAMP domain-containing protein